MDQPNGVPDGSSLIQSIKLKTNDFPIDLTKATIYKYTIEFSPDNINTKEKKVLSENFLSRLKLDYKSPSFIRGSNFEIFLPRQESELEEKALQAVFLRKKETANLATDSSTSSQATKSRNNFITDVLIARKTKSVPTARVFPNDEGGLHICSVYAEGAEIKLDYFRKGVEATEVKETESPDWPVTMDALDHILLREAHDTKSVQVHGRRIYDMAGKPLAMGEGVELRRGFVTETCITNSSMVRRITPCTGFFIPEMNLAELLHLLRPMGSSKLRPFNVEEVNKVLKGVTIKKTRGKHEVTQILGLMAGNPDQETFYWNNHKITTVSYYMEKGKVSICIIVVPR
jgi:hypothetical protein